MLINEYEIFNMNDTHKEFLEYLFCHTKAWSSMYFCRVLLSLLNTGIILNEFGRI